MGTLFEGLLTWLQGQTITTLATLAILIIAIAMMFLQFRIFTIACVAGGIFLAANAPQAVSMFQH